MEKEVVFNTLSDIRTMYPKNYKTSTGWILDESTTHIFFAGPAWATRDETDMLIAVELHLPELPKVELTKKNVKTLNKINKKFLSPKGFELRSKHGEYATEFWLSTAVRFPISKDEFRQLETTARILAMTIFSGLGSQLDFSI